MDVVPLGDLTDLRSLELEMYPYTVSLFGPLEAGRLYGTLGLTF